MIISIENTVVRKLHSIKGVQERQWMHHTAAANKVILFVSKSTTLSQKTTLTWLAITLTCMNRF